MKNHTYPAPCPARLSSENTPLARPAPDSRAELAGEDPAPRLPYPMLPASRVDTIMSFHHPRIVPSDPAHISSKRFTSLGLLEKAEAIMHMNPPPDRPKGGNPRQVEVYWRELVRLGEIDREWQSSLLNAICDVERGTLSLADEGLADILTPEVIARFRTRDYLSVSAETQAVANRSAATLFGLVQGMPIEVAEMCSGRTGEVERILAHPERAVDRLVYEGFLAPDRAHEILGALCARQKTREAA